MGPNHFRQLVFFSGGREVAFFLLPIVALFVASPMSVPDCPGVGGGYSERQREGARQEDEASIDGRPVRIVAQAIRDHPPTRKVNKEEKLSSRRPSLPLGYYDTRWTSAVFRFPRQ